MSLNLFHNYINCLQKYDDFSGKSSRVEFWSFALVNFIIYFLMIILLGDNSKFHIIFRVLIFLPALAITVRRLHDVGKSGEILIAIPLSAFLGYIFMNSQDEISHLFGILFAFVTLMLNLRLFFLLIQDTQNEDHKNIGTPSTDNL